MASIKPNWRLNASSLLEIVVAMVVIIVVFGIAMVIFNNVIRSSLSLNKIRARALVQTELLEAERQNIADTSFTRDDIRYERTVTNYKNSPDIRIIQIVALDPRTDTLAFGRKVIIIP